MPASSTDDPLAGLGAERWDALAAPHFYSSSAWLTYCARNSTSRIGALLATDDSDVLAAVPVTEVRSTLPEPYRWNDRLAAAGLPGIAATGWMLGVQQGYQTHILHTGGHDPVDGVRGILARARRLRGTSGDATVGMYLSTADVRLARQAGVRAVPVLLEAEAWIDVPDSGWDGWLAALTGKRRSTVRREVRRFADAGFTITHHLLADCHDVLGALARSTEAKYGEAHDAAVYGWLMRSQATTMGSAARVALCHRPGEDPVGFCIYYDWCGTTFLRWVGFDYDRLEDAGEYFNLTYYTHIAGHPAGRAGRIHAGTNAIEAKALRGANLQPLWMLDLDDDSVLIDHEPAVREHNRGLVDRYLSDPRTDPSLVDRDAWTRYT